MPTSAPANVQAELIALTKQTIKNHGIKNGFFNVDMWHWHGKKPCKVIEVNSRAASLYFPLYKECFDANLYRAMLFLCLGDDKSCYQESPSTKILNQTHHKVGALFFVVTFAQGDASQLINFEMAEKMKGDPEIISVELYVEPHSKIGDNGSAGFRMAKFYLAGESMEKIQAIADRWRSLLVKKPESSPYKNLCAPPMQAKARPRFLDRAVSDVQDPIHEISSESVSMKH